MPTPCKSHVKAMYKPCTSHAQAVQRLRAAGCPWRASRERERGKAEKSICAWLFVVRQHVQLRDAGVGIAIHLGEGNDLDVARLDWLVEVHGLEITGVRPFHLGDRRE